MGRQLSTRSDIFFHTGIHSHEISIANQKSVNLQYNTLVRCSDGTKGLMFQVLFFFHKILQKFLQKPFQFIFLFFYKITKIKLKSFECPKSIKNYEKKYLERQTLGRRVICPIGPANQRIIL